MHSNILSNFSSNDFFEDGNGIMVSSKEFGRMMLQNMFDQFDESEEFGINGDFVW